MRRHGITLVELMVAIAVLAIGFTALLYSQVGNLQTSSRAKTATQVKAVANQVLERKLAEVLVVEIDDRNATPAGSTDTIDDNNYIDDANATVFGKTGVKQSFYFTDYFWRCPGTQTPPSDTRSGSTSKLRDVDCTGSTTSDGITANWAIRAQSGVTGEGVLDVVVTATHTNGSTLTIGDRISCYDIYPAPSANAPKPCPKPGSGRS